MCRILAILPAAALPAAEVHRAEVAVYAATAGGAMAAVAAARQGKRVVLIEPGSHVGGMVSGGLGATDHGNRAAVGGYAREFFARVLAHYENTYGEGSEQVRDSSGGFYFEPHVAERVLRAMLEEAGVRVVFGEALAGIEKSGGRIEAIRARKGARFEAQVFVDASYEGDLLAACGVSSAVGREGRARYGESIAGVQERSPAHQWPLRVAARDERGNLLPLVQTGPAGEPGAEDRKVQAYNFRLCMTDRAENRVPFPKPEGYDPKRYELLARYLALRPSLRLGDLMNPRRMPNGKTDTNNNGPFSTDHIGASWDYPEAGPEARARIWKDHVEYTQGFLHFLASDPRVPAPLREEMSRWGLARDEFTDTGNWPHQLYVREARRMLGEYVMTEADIRTHRTKDDSVGLGSYNTDSHHVQRVAAPDGSALNEGDFQVRVEPYAIPYRSLVPRASECENLLVPVCMSASHVAYGTVRMEPVYMILGHASGVAAALAIEEKAPVQRIAIARLQALLKAQKAVLSPESLPGPASPPARLDPAKLEGIVVDDAQAEKFGSWTASTSVGPFVGAGYLHDGNAEQGRRRVRFTPRLPRAGRYEVRLVYSAHPNRATNAKVAVRTAGGERTVRVNQRHVLPGGKPLPLGVFELAAGDEGWVEVQNDGADGHVIADAVVWVAVE